MAAESSPTAIQSAVEDADVTSHYLSVTTDANGLLAIKTPEERQAFVDKKMAEMLTVVDQSQKEREAEEAARKKIMEELLALRAENKKLDGQVMDLQKRIIDREDDIRAFNKEVTTWASAPVWEYAATVHPTVYAKLLNTSERRYLDMYRPSSTPGYEPYPTTLILTVEHVPHRFTVGGHHDRHILEDDHRVLAFVTSPGWHAMIHIFPCPGWDLNACPVIASVEKAPKFPGYLSIRHLLENANPFSEAKPVYVVNPSMCHR